MITLRVIALDGGDQSLIHFFGEHQLATYSVGALIILALILAAAFILNKIQQKDSRNSSKSDLHR